MGCTICQQARRTLWEEPAAYSWKHDRRRSAEAYLQWANAELAEEASRCPDLFGNPDYVMGFRDGFVDFVWAGGTGEPPPVPPRPFWNVMLRSPDGKARANQWFDGYRHGADVARDRGYRDLGTVHSSLVGFANRRDPLTYPPLMNGIPAPDAAQPWQESEPLPQPSGAAPQQPSPFESDAAPEDDSAGDPATESGPATTPAVEETPFQDDPQAPSAESDDQPLSLDAAANEPHLEPPHEVTENNKTSSQEPETGEFDVQPAILLNENQATGSNLESASTVNHPLSTVKFTEKPSDSEADASPHCGQQSQRVAGATNAARRAIRRNSFRGWTRSGTATSASHSQLRVLDN
jgi:hypothetical protein